MSSSDETRADDVAEENESSGATLGTSSEVVRQTEHTPEARGRSREVTEFVRPTEAPPVSEGDKAKAGGFLVLFGSFWLFILPWVFTYPHNDLGSSNHARDIVVAITGALCGLWMIRSPRTDTVAVVFSGMAGIGLLIGALFFPGDSARMIGGEAFGAFLLIVGSGLHWLVGHRD